MAFADINGITVHYELIGDPDSKKILVCSNSLGTDFRIWLPLFDELAESITVLLYDSRGHGLTGSGDGDFGMDDLVDDLAGLVDYLGIEKAVFCGLSVGGLIVQGLWAKRPELMKKIILAHTAPKMGTADSWNGRIDAIRDKGMASIGEAVMQRWFTPNFHETRAEELGGYRLMLERQPAEGYIQTCTAIRDSDFTETAKTITVPVLFLAGDEDGAAPAELVEAAAALVPGARYELIESCGHIPCVEQPERLAALIDGFMRKS